MFTDSENIYANCMPCITVENAIMINLNTYFSLDDDRKIISLAKKQKLKGFFLTNPDLTLIIITGIVCVLIYKISYPSIYDLFIELFFTNKRPILKRFNKVIPVNYDDILTQERFDYAQDSIGLCKNVSLLFK